jgi:hypothetical protein
MLEGMKLLYYLFALLFFFGSYCIPIETPDQPERNKLVINAPAGWAYRTFKGNNGLIGVLWPKGTSFNDCDTAVFVFIQHIDEPFLPEIPENSHLFKEKCPKAEFNFAHLEDDQDATKSIEEKYFTGLCGRTEVLFEEKIQNVRVITVLASSFYVSKNLFEDVKYIVSAYRKEVEKDLKNKKIQEAKTKNRNKNKQISRPRNSNKVQKTRKQQPKIARQPEVSDDDDDDD